MKLKEKIINNVRFYESERGALLDAELIDSAMEDCADIHTEIMNIKNLIDTYIKDTIDENNRNNR